MKIQFKTKAYLFNFFQYINETGCYHRRLKIVAVRQ